MLIGTFVDGRELEYNESIYQFTIGKAPVSLAELRAMDAAGQVSWNMQEQRDWMRSLDEQAFNAEHIKAAGGYVAPQAAPQQQQGFQGQPAQGPGPLPPTNAQPYYNPQNVHGQPQGQPQKNTTKTVLIIVGVAVAVLLLCCCSCCYGCVGLFSDPNSGVWEELDAIERYADEINATSSIDPACQQGMDMTIYLDELQ